MKRLVLAYTLVLFAAANSEALPGTCLSAPFPSTPAPPVFSFDGSPLVHFDLWRQACQDGSGQTAMLVRASLKTNVAPFLCSQHFTIIQGVQIQGRIAPTPGQSFCDDLFIPTTFLLLEHFGEPAFNAAQAFTLLFEGPSLVQLQVPAAGPAPTPPPGVQVVITGCNPCKIGQLAKLHLHVTNPGPARYVEVKAGSHFPDGTTTFVFLGRYVEMLIPAGESTIDIPGLTLPAGLPFGTYTIESALLEPDFGATLSRHSVTATLNP